MINIFDFIAQVLIVVFVFWFIDQIMLILFGAGWRVPNNK